MTGARLRRNDGAPRPATAAAVHAWRPGGSGTVALALDALVAGVHFRADAAPRTIGHKALAVNLSDLAAMGARPRRALAVAAHPGAPAAREAWEAEFAAGFEALAARFAVRVERAPLRCAPLFAAVEAAGDFPGPDGAPLRRSGARPGDAVYVTGALGDAAGALRGVAALAERLDRPEPRVQAGLALRGIASSAIDVSDGLCADLGHLLAASGAGAALDTARLPLSAPLLAACGRRRAEELALAGGDDYELAFTVPPERERALARAALGVPAVRIGTVEERPGLRCFGPDGEPRAVPATGYEHFESPAGGPVSGPEPGAAANVGTEAAPR